MIPKSNLILILSVFALFFGSLTHADETDKLKYNLFYPVPVPEMREFDSDRPGVTDTPTTVDAGHFKAEVGVFNFNRADDQNTVSGASVSVDAGLFSFLELQAGFDGLQNRDHTLSTTIRIKYNVTGNDEGRFALGFIPAVQIPSSGNFREAFGIPMTYDFSGEWVIGFMPQFDQNDVSLNLILNHTLGNGFDGFVEFQSLWSDDANIGRADVAGAGMIYQVNFHLAVDAELKFGLNQPADTFNLLTGFVFRY